MERIDCHCHVFNILSVGWRAILEQLHESSELIIEEGKKKQYNSNKEIVKHQSVFDKLKRLAELIAIFTDNSEKILAMLDSHYHQEYKLFPLMFDGDFLLDSAKEENVADIKKIMDTIKMYLLNPNLKVTQKSLNKNRAFSDDDINRLLDLLKYLDQNISSPYNKKSNENKKDGFTIQYEELVKIADNPKYKNRVFPFLGVDPRRENIRTYFNQVGSGKVFAGIKVYPPNGFSPMDKLLVGSNSVFEYCCLNQIPVISHCSFGGFATPAMSIDLNGYIIPKGKTDPVEYIGEYRFDKSIIDGFTVMVQERASVLNHPKIWRKVLENNKGLLLVLAHFGSGSDEWQSEILKMMKDFPNLYTDVSCMSDDTTLAKVKDIYDKNLDVRDRILYGSDYFLDMFFNDSFDLYLNRIKAKLGQSIFDKISSENPLKFKNKWYKSIEQN